MSFQNFVLYPERSLNNVIYYAQDTIDTQIHQGFTEEYNKTIVYSNPELQEIDIESKRNLTLVQGHDFLNFSQILPANLNQSGSSQQD